MAGVVWILCMSAFVKPIVWGSIIAIPIMCLGIFTFIVTDALLGKANDPVYLDPQYNWMIGVAILFLIASIASGTFLYRERRNIDRAINIIHLACQILWETPSIFTLSLGIMGVYSIFSFAWAFAFSHLFLPISADTPPQEGLAASTEGAIFFFVFMHFWFTAVLSSVEKMTIAGVVGQWYFARTLDETFDEDLVGRSLKATLGPGFGSVCLASLVVGTVEVCQFVVRNVRKHSRGSAQPLISLVDSCLDCVNRSVTHISSYTLLYCGLTGASLCTGALGCTRLFRRNLVMGMATAGITRAILFFGASAAAGGVGAGTFFYSARGTGSPYAWMVGGVGAFVPFYVVRFMSQIIQNTVDATFLCYMLDVDSNSINCQEAHEIFENDLGL
ncbi:plasma-membrane choline transporter-domain-containing protein [Chytriomyces sp. MP71]|nr:plasma-membrane choline transporter-domain-containing protein [Chytriomyces sp. MP71]